jgi:hypothetical protein
MWWTTTTLRDVQTGAWSNSTSTIFYGSAGDVPYRFGEHQRFTRRAVAKYAPNITVAGHYPGLCLDAQTGRIA